MNNSVEDIRKIGRAIIVILMIISVISLTLKVIEFNEYSQKRTRGEISQEERGDNGFGFDPIFMPSDSPDKTFAEMAIDEKNDYSHRAQALRKFAKWLKSGF